MAARSSRHLRWNRDPELAAGVLEWNALIEGVAVLGSQIIEDARKLARVLAQLA